MKPFRTLATLAVFAVSMTDSAQATPASAQELKSIFTTIENNYGPMMHKKEHLGINWADIKTRYSERAAALESSNEFYFMVAEMLSELKDAHVGVTLPSSYKKSLPLQLAFVEGKTILAYIDDAVLPNCPVEIGDELLKMDNRSPEEIRTELSRVSATGNKRTDQSLQTLQLTSRREERGFKVHPDSNQVSVLEFRSAQANRSIECRLTWKEEGARLVSRPELSVEDSRFDATLDLGLDGEDRLATLFRSVDKLFSVKASVGATEKELARRFKGKGAQTQIGAAQPFFPLPSDFEVIQAPEQLKFLTDGTGLLAGKFTHGGRKIGFLRIPSYEPKQIEVALFGLRYLISRLESETDMLVIDQTNNPGGAVIWSDWIVSSLVGRLDRRHIKFAVRASQHFVRSFSDLVAQLEQPNDAATVEEKELKATFLPVLKEDLEKVKRAYVNREFLSEPIRLHLTSEFSERMASALMASQLMPVSMMLGVDLAVPAQYTKKVFMLVNELDFSGGDATPALLKDYGRVTLVGVNTAGAGGSVQEFAFSQDHTFTFNLTTSLMVRADGGLVENHGVKPDIAFEPTIQDYREGFQKYLPRLLETINQPGPSSVRIGSNNR